jgi:MFS family permease
MAVATLLLGIGFGLTAVADRFWAYAFTVGIWTLGEIIGATIAPAVVADLSPVDLRGTYQGVFGGAFGLAFFLGPVVGGWVFENAGPTTLWSGAFALSVLLALGYLAMARPAAKRMASTRLAANH